MSTALPVLYSFRRCPYAIRARLALAYAGFACELREIKLRDKPQQMLEVSPKGTVPVLVLPDGKVIDQSLEVMLHALQTSDDGNTGDADGWLQPTTGNLSNMLALIERNDSFFKGALDRCKYPDRHGAEDVAQAALDANEWLDTLEQQLAATGYLFGQNPSLADMALRPFVRQFAAIDGDAWAAKPWPHLQAWLQRFLDSALFAEVMQTHSVWVAGTSGPVVFDGTRPSNNPE
ncbi:glutathione S-transferase [Diaphorobacter sp. HDW4A]|uniref:glutathione S-transferase n=1 Tax=Diaphorobacter sp. HDW4A TaxID=2714924 RepID=UPI001409ACAA|nr:glutathione S-transferase [Diaphorobacter sp. HDW4A]QIL80423.1 glutathione S-transferase [Diaphorobacter sp. HDW4A]